MRNLLGLDGTLDFSVKFQDDKVRDCFRNF